MRRVNRVEKLRMDRLVIGAQQARTRDVEQDLDELVTSIRVNGHLEPIIVMPLAGRDGYYEILAGQRRWLAMQRLGESEITAAVIDEPLDRDVASALSVSENVIRRDLNPLDLIDACTGLYHRYGSIKAVADKFGLPYAVVGRYVKFDRLRPALKQLVRAGEVEIRTALKIEDCCDKELDEESLKRVVKTVSGMSLAQQADYFKRVRSPAGRSGAEKPAEPDRTPGAVKQIIVTLSRSDWERLRAWAHAKNLTQDRAGARIIAAFLNQAAASDMIPHPTAKAD